MTVPRIRSIHPTQWTDEDFVEMSALCRLFVLGLRNEADDNGIFPWKPKSLKMRLMPNDDVCGEAMLAEACEAGQLISYEAEGRRYGAIRNFARFQSLRRPVYIYPTTADVMAYVGHGDNPPQDEVDSSDSITTGSGADEASDCTTPKNVGDKRGQTRTSADKRGQTPTSADKRGHCPPGEGEGVGVGSNPPNGGYKRARAKPPPSEADFDLFWEAYGKVGSRQQALKKWNAAIKSGHDPTEIIAAARAYRSHLQSPAWEAGGRSPPFQKHGATWLHNQCWKDELEPIPEPKNGNRNTIHDHCSIDELVERAGLVEGDLDAGSGGDSSIIDANWRIIN